MPGPPAIPSLPPPPLQPSPQLRCWHATSITIRTPARLRPPRDTNESAPTPTPLLQSGSLFFFRTAAATCSRFFQSLRGGRLHAVQRPPLSMSPPGPRLPAYLKRKPSPVSPVASRAPRVWQRRIGQSARAHPHLPPTGGRWCFLSLSAPLRCGRPVRVRCAALQNNNTHPKCLTFL